MAYLSEKLNGAKLKYNTYDVEFYVIVQSLQYWYHYLIHSDFVLYLDHKALKHINNQGKLSERHVKWTAYIQQFSVILKHTSRILNRVIDALSR